MKNEKWESFKDKYAEKVLGVMLIACSVIIIGACCWNQWGDKLRKDGEMEVNDYLVEDTNSDQIQDISGINDPANSYIGSVNGDENSGGYPEYKEPPTEVPVRPQPDPEAERPPAPQRSNQDDEVAPPPPEDIFPQGPPDEFQFPGQGPQDSMMEGPTSALSDEVLIQHIKSAWGDNTYDHEQIARILGIPVWASNQTFESRLEQYLGNSSDGNALSVYR